MGTQPGGGVAMSMTGGVVDRTTGDDVVAGAVGVVVGVVVTGMGVLVLVETGMGVVRTGDLVFEIFLAGMASVSVRVLGLTAVRCFLGAAGIMWTS
jgi:hypothetical protein